jgi:hypothetical protein
MIIIKNYLNETSLPFIRIIALSKLKFKLLKISLYDLCVSASLSDLLFS